MSEGLTFASPISEAAPAVGGRRALVFLDSPPSAFPGVSPAPASIPDSAPDSVSASAVPEPVPVPDGPSQPDARLAGALRAEGFAVDSEHSRGAGDDGERVWEFLRSAQEGDLLVIRLPSDGGWTSGQLGSMIGAFGRQVGESLAAAVLLIVDFGWSALDDSATPVRQLAVAGEPRVAAAALTLTLRYDETLPGPVRSLTDVIAEGLATRAADLDGDGVITVGELHSYALDHYAIASAARTPILITYGAVAKVPLTQAGDPSVPLPAALARAAARLGDSVPPASGVEVVRRVYELHLSEPAKELLRKASLLAEDESVEEVFGDATELRQWGLLGETTTFAHPDVRSFGHSCLSPVESARTSALLRRRRAGRRAVPPRARLTADRWTTEDQLGHRLYAEAIVAFVRHPETRPPLTIGVKGPWGTGKTSLMRMIQDLLDPGAAGNNPAAIHLPGSRADRTPTNAEVLTRAGQRPREGVARAVPGALPVRRADWRPTVWFNPWMYQNGEQVWAGLAHEIISQVTERLPTAERERFWLELNLARIDREAVRRRAYQLALTRLAPLALGLLTTLVLTGALLAASALLPAFDAFLRNAAAAVGSAGSVAAVGAGAVRLARFFGESASSAFSGLVRQPDLLSGDMTDGFAGIAGEVGAGPGYRSRTGFLHLVQTDMRHVLDLVATEERPLVVFVDDLDRCSPGTVAQVIEAINLFLAGEFPNCVFVLAMEPEVVVAHVEAAYRDLAETLPGDGRSGLGWRFLEKIVQLPLSVPLLDDADRLPAFVRALLGMPDLPDLPPSPYSGLPSSGSPPSGPRPSESPGAGAGSRPYRGGSSRSRALRGEGEAQPYENGRGPRGSAPRIPGAGRSGAGRPWAERSESGPGWSGAGQEAREPGSRSRSPVDVPIADPLPRPVEPPDPVQVSRLEDAIWTLRPTAATLDEAARLAQEALGIESPDMIGGLSAAAREAADRVFDDLYSDENAYRAIEFVLPALTFFNPRQIKRYVNVFRFYSFLTYRRTLAGAAPASEAEVAKLAALTIHWPHLLSLLVMEVEGVTVLQSLERAAEAADDKVWDGAVREAGLAGHGAWDDTHLDTLRDLLSCPHPIADLARHLL
ncbi:P-loop NTPase fold protein [Streptosporangium sp. NPDC051022]|uniref:KAP family P-loop NTPase fold protein n=1 Tax=Streptosporangium sp. NPDC051022 TaxID=3155752 RepID=UPI00342A7527